MRITRLEMDNFGPFNGRQVGEFSPGLTVVHGQNEAGKSALRAFMRVVLFGFPQRRSPDRAIYYYEPTLPGGAAGGVHITNSSGDPYLIHRVEGTRGGPVTISGTRDGAEDLLRELTGDVDDAFYQNVFSISLSELQSFEALGRGEITERIYSAGLGIGNISLRDVSKQLDDRISKFRRVRSGSLFDLEKELSAAQGELDDRRRELSGYERISDDLRAFQTLASELEERLIYLRTDESRALRLLKLRDPWLIAQRVRNDLNQLPDTSKFPPGGLERLAEYKHSLNQLEEQKIKGERNERERERHVSGLPVVEVFIDREDDVRHTVSRIGAYETVTKELPGLVASANETEQRVMRDLASIGPKWTAEKLGQFVDPAGSIAKIQTAAEAKDEAGRTSSSAYGDLEASEKDVREATEKLDVADNHLRSIADIPAETIDELKRKRDRLTRLQGAIADLDQDQTRPTGSIAVFSSRNALILGLALIVIGLAGIVWAVAVSEVTGVVIGSVATLTGAFLTIKSGRQELAIGTTEPDVVEEIDLISTELGLTPPITGRLIVEVGNALIRDIERKSESTRLAEDADIALANLENAQTELTTARGRIKAASENQQNTDKAWTTLLQELEFHTHFQRVDALTSINSLSDLRRDLQRSTDIRERVDRMEEHNSDTNLLLTSILEKAGPTPMGSGDGLAALRDLERRWTDHSESLGDRRRIEGESKTWLDEREDLELAIGKAKVEIANLLDTAGCKSADEFRIVAADAEARLELENELETIKRTAPDLFSPEAKEIDTALESTDPGTLGTELQLLNEKVVTTGEERDSAVGQAGEVRAALKQMETEAEVARLHSHIDELTERLREDARQWSVLTVARSLLDQTREEFQEERQPSLLLAASRYFSQMTSGRYSSVRAVIGEERFEVVTTEGRPVRPEHLSRGAAEQLWLSIRFALVDEYGSRSPLPVVLDDLLVNFDPERAAAACTAISALAERQQVIFLTCQPSTVSMLEEAVGANPGASMSTIDLDAPAGGVQIEPTVEVTESPAPKEAPEVTPETTTPPTRSGMQPLL